MFESANGSSCGEGSLGGASISTGTIWRCKVRRNDGTRRQVVVTSASRGHVWVRDADGKKSARQMRRSMFLRNYEHTNDAVDDSKWGAQDAPVVVLGPELRRLKKALDARPREEVVYVIWDLTPALANELIATSACRNRGSTQSHVKEIASDLVDGNYSMTAQGLILSVDMELLDGEHRCRSVISTGITIRVSIGRYWSKELGEAARPNHDGQKWRDKGEALEVEAVPRGKGARVAATLQAIRLIDNRLPPNITKRKVIQIFKDRQDSMSAIHSRATRDFLASVRAALVIAHMKAPNEIEELMDRVISGARLNENSAELLMSKRLPRIQCGSNKAAMVLSMRETLGIAWLHVKGIKPKRNGKRMSLTTKDIERAIQFFLGEYYRDPEV